MEFPRGFLWGAATSSHQVEGDNTNNDWWKAETEGRLKYPSGKACNHYNLYKQDFQLAKELKHNAHRFSLEWSRIEPIESTFDAKSIEHYRDVINALISLDIKPMVTINHYTLPAWFSEKGGWENKDSPLNFANFVKKVSEGFGENVEYWITLNEPVANIYKAYIEGEWPPGKKSFRIAVKVFKNMLKAHSLAYKIIHQTYKKNSWREPKVSIAKHFLEFTPCRKISFFDNLSANLRHYFFNRLFIKSLIRGWCVIPGFGFIRLPAKRTLDFIGLNYYTRDFVHYGGSSPMGIFGSICTLKHHIDSGKRNFLKWEIYPEGIRSALEDYSRFNLPIFITENGICTNNDDERESFIKQHLREIAIAMREGVNVIGYIYWSLVDNFEWAEGFDPRFGLIEIDYETQKRTVRPSAYALSGGFSNVSI